MSKYVDYDNLDIYDKEILGEESLEDKIEDLRNRKIGYKYIVKTIISGGIVECEIYPVYQRRKDIPRSPKKYRSKKSQENLNDKNAIKEYIRLVNTNFSKDDLFMTLSYEDKYLPTFKQAKRDITNYIRRIKRYRDKKGLPKLKYVYVIEWVDEEEQHKSKKVRVHHHIIMSKMDRDVAEDKWGLGRVQAKRLQPDQFGLEGIARYMLKQNKPKGDRRWTPSRNLKKPTIYKSVSKLSKRKAERMAMSPDDMPDLYESLYKGKYRYLDHKSFYSDITGGFYLYCRMRKRE